VDVLGLEVGYRLIPLVDRAQNGDLLKRIRGLRKKFAQDIGFLPAQVHIRDNLELRPNAYRLTLKGVPIGQGEAYPGQFLAINPGRVSGTLPGNPTQDPAFGLPAIWIEAVLREQAHVLGYTVVDAGTVIATHLNHVILSHATELLGRLETQALLDHLATETPKLVEDLVPKLIGLGVLQRVLQNLLDEGVNIRDMRSIIETLAEHAPRTQDAMELTAQVRIALGRAIVQQLYPNAATTCRSWRSTPRSNAYWDRRCRAAMTPVASSPDWPIPCCGKPPTPPDSRKILAFPPCCWSPGPLRWLLSRFLRRAVPDLKVISNSEVPDSRIIKVTSIIGARK
jgi:flagellar biosynthesis protein FlhA